MMTKSETCKNKEGKLRSTRETKQESQEAADYANDKYGNNLVPYKCKRCGLYHLESKGRQTPSSRCESCDKDLYETEDAAKKRAAIRYEEQRVSLRAYECPSGLGYHLTKRGA